MHVLLIHVPDKLYFEVRTYWFINFQFWACFSLFFAVLSFTLNKSSSRGRSLRVHAPCFFEIASVHEL